jgi:DNA-binding transcriptional regulator YhcF (GntR family)
MSKARFQNRTPFQFRLDLHSGVPLYRQLIDQVQAGVAAGTLAVGDQLPTVRQVAVDLEINPNTVQRAYREMEIRGLLDTQQGSGTFVTKQKAETDKVERMRRLEQLVSEFAARAGAGGFTLDEVMGALRERFTEIGRKRR